jgi:WD40 repeat protein
LRDPPSPSAGEFVQAQEFGNSDWHENISCMNSDQPVATPFSHDRTALPLPDHILFDLIEDFMDSPLPAIGKVAQVCREYQDSLSNPIFWKLKLYDRFDSHFFHPSFTPLCQKDPKKVYKATHTLEKTFTRGLFNAKSNFRTPNSIITAIRIHKGKLVVGQSDGTVKFIELSNDGGREQEEGGGHGHSHPNKAGVSCLAPIGSGIVSGHMDGTFMLHNPTTGDHRLHVNHEFSRVSSVSSVSDSLIVTSSTADRSIQLYDLERQISILSKRTSPDALPHSVSSRSSLGIIGHRDKKVRLLDFRAGEYIAALDMDNWCLCVEADIADHILRASDKAVKTFDIRSSNQPCDVRHGTKRLISQFKSDSRLRLVSCGLDGQVLVSSLEPCNSPAPPQPVHACDDYILSVDFDRTRLACGGINGKYNLFTF